MSNRGGGGGGGVGRGLWATLIAGLSSQMGESL